MSIHKFEKDGTLPFSRTFPYCQLRLEPLAPMKDTFTLNKEFEF